LILPNFILPSRVNQHWTYSGIDSPDQCADRQWFDQYPYTVEYHYNSRGFRDQEWPTDIEELKNAIWCVGDSFTVGLGSPVHHTWPYLLQAKTSTRTINVSMDGASNKWIARKTVDIVNNIQPKVIVLQWSYLFRDESTDTTLSDEQRRQPYSDDTLLLSPAQLLQQFVCLINQVEQSKQRTKIVHSFIPGFCFSTNAVDEWNQLRGPSWPDVLTDSKLFDKLPTLVHNDLKMFEQYDVFRLYAEMLSSVEIYVEEFIKQDLARDGHHYDLITASNFVSCVCKKLHNRAV